MHYTQLPEIPLVAGTYPLSLDSALGSFVTYEGNTTKTAIEQEFSRIARVGSLIYYPALLPYPFIPSFPSFPRFLPSGARVPPAT